jgi:hypothetical protein
MLPQLSLPLHIGASALQNEVNAEPRSFHQGAAIYPQPHPVQSRGQFAMADFVKNLFGGQKPVQASPVGDAGTRA